MTAAARVRARRFGVWFVAMALAIAWSVILLPTASADKTINGCTIVDNPTPTRITTCQGADLPNVDLNLANLAGASLFGTRLNIATLQGAVLTRADLSGANLIFANLFGANLTSANLSGATLIAANLTDANLTFADLPAQTGGRATVRGELQRRRPARREPGERARCELRQRTVHIAGRAGHRLLFVLGELVQTTAGKWITPPADAMPERAHHWARTKCLGRRHQACLGHGGGHTTWTCRTCDQTVYGPPLNTHCTALDGPATVRISTARD